MRKKKLKKGKMRKVKPELEAVPTTKMKPTMDMNEHDMPEVKHMKHGQKIKVTVHGTVKQIGSLYNSDGKARAVIELDKMKMAQKIKTAKAPGNDL